MQKIPLSTNPNQQFSCVLDDQNCTITIKQNGARVYASLSVDQESVFDSQFCRDRVLLPTFSTIKFNGHLAFVDTRSKSNPDYTGFGDRFILVFLSEGEAWPV